MPPATLITTAPLDHDAIVRALDNTGIGAVAVFVGLVRDHNKGKRVLYLDYEAYEPLALAAPGSTIRTVIPCTFAVAAIRASRCARGSGTCRRAHWSAAPWVASLRSANSTPSSSSSTVIDERNTLATSMRSKRQILQKSV